MLISGKSTEHSNGKVDRVVRLKNSFAQDIVYAVSNGTTKKPKSVLFPSVIKSLCNMEIVKLVNKYGHGISYNLLEDVETEYALKIIDKQAENKVICLFCS